MNGLFNGAENMMYVFNHPYVGTEHYLLAFLKKYKLNTIKYYDFRKMIIDTIGYGSIPSQHVLYTPILRDIKNRELSEKEAVLEILLNEDSIAHNILVCKKININGIINEVKNLE